MTGRICQNCNWWELFDQKTYPIGDCDLSGECIQKRATDSCESFKIAYRWDGEKYSFATRAIGYRVEGGVE
jgi:hypothetical protein